MFKKHIKNSIIVAFLILTLSTTAFAGRAIVDTNNLDKGLVAINYSQNTDKMKVLITKGSNRYDYDLKSNMTYPLQFGNGDYTIQIVEHVSGTSYRQVEKQIVRLNLNDQKELFKQSTHMVNWNNDMAAIKKAKELTKNAKTDEDKLAAVYTYVVNNIKYDYPKASTVKAGYLPTIDSTLASNKGICYDYSVLTAGMLRSVGVPTKLIMGYNSEIAEYHAWNEVYINGTWMTIDTTFDSAYAEKNIAIKMVKDKSQYTTSKEY